MEWDKIRLQIIEDLLGSLDFVNRRLAHGWVGADPKYMLYNIVRAFLAVKYTLETLSIVLPTSYVKTLTSWPSLHQPYSSSKEDSGICGEGWWLSTLAKMGDRWRSVYQLCLYVSDALLHEITMSHRFATEHYDTVLFQETWWFSVMRLRAPMRSVSEPLISIWWIKSTQSWHVGSPWFTKVNAISLPQIRVYTTKGYH